MSKDQQEPYPRPDFQRSDLYWGSLSGTWNFAFDDGDVGLSAKWQLTGLCKGDNKAPIDKDLTEESHHVRQIQVPFVFQTPASGVNDQGAHEIIWYERNFEDIRSKQQADQGYQLHLRFGAVDYEAKVWVNGQYVGSHRGGHVPFDIDVTDAVQPASSSQRITVRVRDSPHDLTQPRGKQFWKPVSEEIYYTPSSGIWQTVWLEVVPSVRIADSSHGTVLRANDIESGYLHADVAILGRSPSASLLIELSASIGDIQVSSVRQPCPHEKGVVSLDLPLSLAPQQIDSLPDTLPSLSTELAWRSTDCGDLALWSPDYPLLYDITIKLVDEEGKQLDEVRTTVGMRSLSWNHPDRAFRLNNKPYFQALVLDQGYWPNTNITPPSADALKRDIEISKAMGFNGCRKHQKVEDPMFLYWADRLGYIVWGEMANAFEFSSTYIDRFDQEWKEAVKRDINHPCIVTWTPGNESWGYDDLGGNNRQRDHLRSLYYATKSLDPTRPVNDNCGWEHVATDLTTFHEYADAPGLQDICANMEGILGDKGGRPMFVPPTRDDAGSKLSPSAPILCTEFGGVNIAPAEGEESGTRDWGYTTASDPDDLLKRLEALVMAVVSSGYCCGFVYTQLTDIEQEVNGLYTFDRRPKLAPKKVKNIMDRAKRAYYELLEKSRSSVSQDG